MALPPLEAEDGFVADLIEGGEAEQLAALVSEALGARRFRLAARLVGLIDPSPEEDPALTRARRAASLLLVEGGSVAAAREQDLQTAWSDLRDRLVLGSRSRHRALLRPEGTLPRGSRRR